MILGKKTLFSLLLGAELLTNVLELVHVNFLYTTTFLSFCTSILLPGLLLSLILRLKKVSVWENILFIVGLGIAFLEFGGLLLNTLFPLFGINNPLAFQNLIVGFDVYTLLLFIFAWIRTKSLVIHIRLPRRSNMEKIYYAVPLFFPVLAALGAIVLNNGGSNILTLMLLGMIGGYTLLLVIFREKISVDLYPYALFFIAVACLFTTSLRSWFITGHDIEKEFYVFQLTNAHHLWNMAFFQDAYNACLSITILPTILTNLLPLQDMYVYKVIFQVLFATSPVLVFFIVKKYTLPVFAFLSAFFFLSFPLFFTDMPMINRQEIAFIFFGLVVYMMLVSELPILTRKMLFLIFSLSTAISHYSTYYILLPLLFFLYFLSRLIAMPFMKNMINYTIKITHVKFKSRFNANNAFLTLPMLLLLFGMTYFWYTLYTHTFNNLASVVATVISDEGIKPSDLSYYLFSPQDPNKQLQTYIQSLVNSEKADASQRYSKTITGKYKTYAVPQESVAPTPFGNLLTTLYIPEYKNQEAFSLFFAAFLQLFVLIGWLALCSLTLASFRSLKGKTIRRLAGKTTDKLVEPRFSLKTSGAPIEQAVFAIDRQETLQLPSIVQYKRLARKTIDRVIEPRFSLKISGVPIEQAALAIDRQETLQLPRMVQHVPYSVDSNIFEDASRFGNPTPSPNYKNLFDRQFLFLCLGAIFFLVLMLVLPNISALFGVLRMTQQFLFMLSLPIVLGVYFLLFFMKKPKRILLTGIMLIIFFLNFTGFIPHLTGGYYPQINLDNAGLYYDVYYVHKSDILAITWLAKNNTDHQPVESDASGMNKMQTFGNINASSVIFPSLILKNAYVYLENTTPLVIDMNNKLQPINSSQKFLEKHKNHIYSNGDINIYK